MDKIMIVEDDPKLALHLQGYIEKYGFQAVMIDDFEHILDRFLQTRPQLVLLDINLPYFDGYYWCRQIRQESLCPVIFISARTGEMDQVMAIENGGDDYMTKPFHSDVVMAKIRSQLRRAYGEYAGSQRERIIEKGDVQLYPERFELYFRDKTVMLSKNECDIIALLLERHPRVAGREDLLEKLWDDQTYVDENTLNVNITRVRKKFQELGIEGTVETVRGAGYRLRTTWEETPE